MNNTKRFVIMNTLWDGSLGYFCQGANGPEWNADRAKAKVYKLRAAAEAVVREYSGTLVPLDDEEPAPADAPAELKLYVVSWGAQYAEDYAQYEVIAVTPEEARSYLGALAPGDSARQPLVLGHTDIGQYWSVSYHPHTNAGYTVLLHINEYPIEPGIIGWSGQGG